MKRLFSLLIVLLAAVALAGCDAVEPPPEPEPDPAESAAESTAETEPEPASEPEPEPEPQSASERLAEVLADMPEDTRARYEYRNPAETLEFFGIEPGMTVVESLPGMGWYSRILAGYLGPDGRLIGATYDHDMWPLFGFFDQEFIDSMETWPTDWPADAREWHGEDGAAIDAFEFGSMPDSMEGQADAVLIVRALHNLVRYEEEGGYLSDVLDDVQRVLKPGGIVGVVQHEARPEVSDESATGERGYLKKQFVIDRMTEAGFEFVAETDINENPADQPGEEDIVWRLPPTLMTSQDDPELRAEMTEIGESNRMTLKFRKPEASQ